MSRYYAPLLPLLFWACAPAPNSSPEAPLPNRATPAPPLTVLRADSDEERKALDEAFAGVTNDGQVQPGLYTVHATGVSTEPILEAVMAFRASLTETQRAASSFPLQDREWRRWTNIDIGEYSRYGVGLGDMTQEQKELGLNILRVGLSPQGYKKTEDIRKMEAYLARLSGAMDILGPDLYWFTFMGEPSATEPWGWQFDGHHLVINYFVLGDQVVMTPTFMGSEPNYIADGEDAGTRTFESEEALGIEFYRMLDSSQRVEATLYNEKHSNYNQAESFRDNAVIPFAGIRASRLSAGQRSKFNELIAAYIDNMSADRAKIKRKEIADHLDDTWFAWVGDTQAAGPFYYRIQSPVILIEFDHMHPVFLEGDEPTKAHVHTVVRTPNGNDYGKDLLRQHLERHTH